MCVRVGTEFWEHRFLIDWAQGFTDWFAHGLQFAEVVYTAMLCSKQLHKSKYRRHYVCPRTVLGNACFTEIFLNFWSTGAKQCAPSTPGGLHWARRVAGRRFEDFLGRDAFGPAHLGCGPDANCSKGIKAEYLGKFQMDGPVLNKNDGANGLLFFATCLCFNDYM